MQNQIFFNLQLKNNNYIISNQIKDNLKILSASFMPKRNLSETFKHWSDGRSTNQKAITRALVNHISTRNLLRVEQQHKPEILLRQTETLFLLICGVPPAPNQYSAYKFPGKVVQLTLPGYEPNFESLYETDQKKKEYLTKISMENTVNLIDKIVKTHNDRVVIVCHSFGSFIASAYCALYPTKILGFISIGGPVLRFYPVFKDYVKGLMSIPGVNRDMIVENYEMVWQIYDEEMKKHPTMNRFPNPYQHMSFILHNLEPEIEPNFDKIKQLPNILMCFIYGEKDTVMSPTLCEEYAAYLCFLKENKFNKEYEVKLRSSFQKMNLIKISEDSNGRVNLQEHFVYSLPKGGHGVHYTGNYTKSIQKIINDYLSVILNDNETPTSKL